MQLDDKQKESLDFVTRHYRHGAFDTEKSIRELFPRRQRQRLGVAAAIAGAVILTASAIGIWRYNETRHLPEGDTGTATETVLSADEKIRIEFDNAPLTVVVRQIENDYGVTVGNMPADADELRLTLSYEGTAEELVDVINSLLGTEMEVTR